MMAAIQFWILPAIATGALPWLLELNRDPKLPNRKIRPLWYYLGAAVLGPLVATLTLVTTQNILLLLGVVMVLATAWIGAFSRPGSFDPFLGAWCVVNGICAAYACSYRGDLASLGYLKVWAFIGLPLAMVALVIATILHQLRAAPAPETQGTDPEHPAAEQ